MLEFLKVKKYNPVQKGTSAAVSTSFSKEKIGSLIAGIGAIAVTAGQMISGEMDVLTGISLLGAEIGVVLTIFGFTNTITDSIVNILQNVKK